MTKDQLLDRLRTGESLTGGNRLKLSLLLSIPSIIAQLSAVLNEYIDAAMVGHIGASAAASVGLVMTSTWIFFGFSTAACQGFSVQVAHLCGAKDFASARKVMRQGIGSVFLFSVFLALIGVLIGGRLPHWLGGNEEICADATSYFVILMLGLPFMSLGYLSSSVLQASGNVKVPSIMFILACVLDVVFNYIFIYVFDMGVTGAAVGTALSEFVGSFVGVGYMLLFSKDLNIRGERGRFRPERKTIQNAWTITGPMWLQNVIMRGAYVAGTVIVAPLGAISIAANAFAVTAESFCYLPGYGVEEAATSLVGQSLGAGRKDEATKFARITIVLASAIMTVLGIAMFFGAEILMGLMTKDAEVIALGAKVLRIEAFAETLYAVSIVAYGACVGAGNTLVPSLINFLSMWFIRIVPSYFLVPEFGLKGFWMAMCIELNIRGILFLLYMRKGKWQNSKMKIRKGNIDETDF